MSFLMEAYPYRTEKRKKSYLSPAGQCGAMAPALAKRSARLFNLIFLSLLHLPARLLVRVRYGDGPRRYVHAHPVRGQIHVSECEAGRRARRRASKRASERASVCRRQLATCCPLPLSLSPSLPLPLSPPPQLGSTNLPSRPNRPTIKNGSVATPRGEK